MIDLGVHVIDLTRYLLGNPKPVSVYGATFYKMGDRRELKDKKGYVASSATGQEEFNVEDLASAMIRFDNGAVVSVEASYSLNIKEDEGKIELFGTKAGAKLDQSRCLSAIGRSFTCVGASHSGNAPAYFSISNARVRS